MNARRAKSWTKLSLFVIVCSLSTGLVVWWPEICTAYHLRRVEKDHALLSDLASAPQGTFRRRAALEFARSDEGEQAILRSVLDIVVKDGKSSDEAIANASFCAFKFETQRNPPKLSFDIRTAAKVHRETITTESLAPLYTLFDDLEGENIVLPEYPKLVFQLNPAARIPKAVGVWIPREEDYVCFGVGPDTYSRLRCFSLRLNHTNRVLANSAQPFHQLLSEMAKVQGRTLDVPTLPNR